VARHFGLRNGEAHATEEPAGAALADVFLGLRVGRGRRCTDDVEAELACDAFEIARRHAR
jgi:hypothetical protein